MPLNKDLSRPPPLRWPPAETPLNGGSPHGSLICHTAVIAEATISAYAAASSADPPMCRCCLRSNAAPAPDAATASGEMHLRRGPWQGSYSFVAAIGIPFFAVVLAQLTLLS